MVCAMRAQWPQRVSRNSTTTTLPLKLASDVALPDGSMMTRSDAGRGSGAALAEQNPSAARMVKPAIVFARIIDPPLAAELSHLPPALGDPAHFRFRRARRVFRAELVLDDSHEHPRDDEAVEHFHRHRVGVAGKAEVPRPVERVLQLLVLVGRVRLRVVLEPSDQVGNRLLEDWKVAAAGLLVARLGTADE